MRFTTREITGVAIITALILTAGYLLYVLSRLFPFPGTKFVFLSVLLGFAFTVLFIRYNKRGILLISGIIFALLMSLISPLMGVAIIFAALCTELSIYVYGGYDKKKPKEYGAAFFPFYAWMAFVVINYYILGYEFDNSIIVLIIIIGILIYFLGLLGGKIALYFFEGFKNNL